VEEGEVVILHYLEGYSYAEIAGIVRAPVTTVKYRLSAARARLQRELGEGDLTYLNEPGMVMRQWSWLPLDRMRILEARLSRPESLLSTEGKRKMSDPTSAGMSRRKLLETAGTAAAAAGMNAAAAVAAPHHEAEI